jgi:hypothetical protein
MEAIGIEAIATSSEMEIDEMKASKGTEEERQHGVSIKRTKKLDMIYSQADLQIILVQFKRRISGVILVLVERDELGFDLCESYFAKSLSFVMISSRYIAAQTAL